MEPRSQHQKPRIAQWFVGALLLLTCFRVWTGPEPLLPKAQAQIPDSAAQRQKLIEEVQRANELLTQIKDALTDGTLNVRLRGADNP